MAKMGTKEERGRGRKGRGGRSRRGPVRGGVLERYYAGEAVPCPVGCGGEAEVVRVGTAGGGGGEVWLECTSCAQRGRYEISPATSTEKAAANEALGSGRPAVCVRHRQPTALARRGRKLICGACGIVYRD